MVGDQLRKNANKEDLAELEKVNRQTYSTSNIKTTIIPVFNIPQTIQQRFESDETFSSVFKCEHVMEYVREAVKLSWKMALQRPAMDFHLATNDEPWSDVTAKKFELAWGSTFDKESQIPSIVSYTVNPALVHGKNIMGKGKVFVESMK